MSIDPDSPEADPNPFVSPQVTDKVAKREPVGPLWAGRLNLALALVQLGSCAFYGPVPIFPAVMNFISTAYIKIKPPGFARLVAVYQSIQILVMANIFLSQPLDWIGFLVFSIPILMCGAIIVCLFLPSLQADDRAAK
ncbi:hypothetical protein GC197_13500 [bacterium]|nr:hypothetical protein [bacterium]